MRLYYSLTIYQLLCVLLHRMKSMDKKSDIMLSDGTVDLEIIKDHIEKSNLFNKIYIFPDKMIKSKRIRRDHYDEQIAPKLIAENVELVKQNLPVNLNQYDEIFLCADQFPLGIYINANNIKHYFFEEGNGQQSRRDTTVEYTMKEKDPYLYWIVKKLGLYGENDNVINCFIDFDSQVQGYYNEKAIDFSVKREFQALSDDNKKLILEIFDESGYELESSPESSALYLPQQSVNLGGMTVEEQLYQTSLLLDYFCEQCNNIVIKPHPNDIFTDYSKLGEMVEILPRKFPVELLLLKIKSKFKVGVTAWSTSIHTLSAILERSICFEASIEKEIYKIHRYYAASEAVKIFMKTDSISTIMLIGTNKGLFNNLLDKGEKIHIIECDVEYLLQNENSFGNIVIIDELKDTHDIEKLKNNMTKLLKNKNVIFINSLDDYIFFNGCNYEIFFSMVSWNIKKKTTKEIEKYSTINYSDEEIWIYMDNQENYDIIKREAMSKELKFSNIILEINSLDDYDINKDKYIYLLKTVEGMLKAANKRIEIQQKENEILKNKIQDLISIQDNNGKKNNIEQIISQVKKLEEAIIQLNGGSI